jgi:hypothetical protein
LSWGVISTVLSAVWELYYVHYVMKKYMLRGDAEEKSVYFIGFHVNVLGTRGIHIVTTNCKVVPIHAMKS